MDNPLTKRQAEILKFIKRNPRASVREIAKAFGIKSPNGVMCHIKALEKKGAIRRGPAYFARSLTVRGGVTDEQIAELHSMDTFDGKLVALGDHVYRLTKMA